MWWKKVVTHTRDSQSKKKKKPYHKGEHQNPHTDPDKIGGMFTDEIRILSQATLNAADVTTQQESNEFIFLRRLHICLVVELD